jgi:hypothetical protein
MMIKEQNNLKAIKIMNKRENLGQLAFECWKFLKDGLMQDGVENICNVYPKHHPIKMGIQNGLKTIASQPFLIATRINMVTNEK